MEFQEKDLLLLVWVHGFKGTDVTFEAFPERVCHLLRETHPTLRVESRVFPAYQTRGELKAATLAFVDWLTTLVVQLEVDHGAGGGAGKAKIVLIGHSMGGLLIADAARDVATNTRQGDQMWPKIVALVAFDTPYLGLHPHVFKHGISTAAGYYDTARNVASNIALLSPIAMGLGIGKFGSKTPPAERSASPSAGTSNSRSTPPSTTGSSASQSSEKKDQVQPTASGSWIPSLSSLPAIPAPSTKTWYGLGAAALGAAAMGTAYYRREDFVNGWKWGAEHMTFVGRLWDQEELKERLDAIDMLDKKHNIRFWNYYTHIPATPPTHVVSRTFTILPPLSHPTYPRWIPATNHLATDEANAHMYMFNGKTNDGFYDMGLAVVSGIGQRVEEEGVVRGSRMPAEEDMEQEAGEKISPHQSERMEAVPPRVETLAGLEGEKQAWR